MSRLAEVIRNARVHAMLGEAVMAALVGLDPARVRQLEAGEVEPRPEELETYAQCWPSRASARIWCLSRFIDSRWKSRAATWRSNSRTDQLSRAASIS
jgi:hypothetical protein